jgi:hypothetical protein
MTIICRDLGLLFLENRNTGSTAIRALLMERLGGEHLITEPVTDASGDVCGVRNPFDLAVTEYARMRSKQSGQAIEEASIELTPSDFERFVRRRYQPSLIHRLTGRRGRVPADFAADADHVIRFERMQADLDAGLRRVGVTEPMELPKKNVTRARSGQDHRALYTPEARRIVESAYADQLARYGYRFEDGPATEAVDDDQNE